MDGTEELAPRARKLALGVAVACGLCPVTALARVHEGVGSGFASGFHHPLSGLDHVLATIAVGLWAAQLGGRAIWVLPVTFSLGLVLGGMLGMAGAHLPATELAIALSAAALGLSVLSEARPKLGFAAVAVALFAFFHGHAHGTQSSEGGGLDFGIGSVLSTGMLLALGLAIGLVRHRRGGELAVRVAGAVVALSGAAFLWRAIAGT